MFEHLFTPITINGMTLANRIIMPAMHLNYTMGGEISDQIIHFYRERAEGEAGLMVIGGCAIDPAGAGFMMVGLQDDKFLPGLKRFVKEVRVGDVKLCTQLYQAGRYSFSMLTGTQSIAPSAIPSKMTGETPKEMTLEDIQAVQDAFGDAAVRTREAGFDAVEICGSAGYLISQFLSPVTNIREDEYGGAYENRVRFGREVIQNVRRKVGGDFPVIVRIAGNDFMEGSHTNIEQAKVAKDFEAAGADCLNVTGGWHETRVPQLTMGVPRGAYTYLASGIKRAVSVPVVACNRINNPALAEKILREDKADLIGIARGFIADEQFAKKAREGRAREIRSCIACNQGCFDHVFQGQPVGCMVNARAGREAETVVKPAETKKKVVVVGGGPAGMEAARVAAERGHSVVLFEATGRLGGRVNQCAVPPGRKEFRTFRGFLAGEMTRLGVDVRMNAPADKATIDAEKPDLVVLAQGAVSIVPGIVKEATGKTVVLAEDILNGTADADGDCVIIGGGAVGTETSLYLAERDVLDPEVACFLMTTGAETYEHVGQMLSRCERNITIVEMLPRIGQDIGKTTRWTMLQDLSRYGIRLLTGTTAKAIDAAGVTVGREDGSEETIPCDCVVVAVGFRTDDALAASLEGSGYDVQVIGDAKQSRRVIDAVREGFDVGAGA